MEIYTQRLEVVTENCDFDVIELTFDTRQKSRFRATLKKWGRYWCRFAAYRHFTQWIIYFDGERKYS